jgi:hypothetical protein
MWALYFDLLLLTDFQNKTHRTGSSKGGRNKHKQFTGAVYARYEHGYRLGSAKQCASLGHTRNSDWPSTAKATERKADL